jgi:hypothetical protein
MLKRASPWPPHSPGALNAWLLLVTTKPPSWRDPLFVWRELPPTLGEPHEGFFYPDPLGFWTEVRHWSLVVGRLAEPGWDVGQALSVTCLLHVGDAPERLSWALDLLRPRVVLFLDEPSRAASGLTIVATPYAIADPHRPGQSYEGFWGVDSHGLVVGKSPQHPASHKLYRSTDLDGFLAAAPLDHSG